MEEYNHLQKITRNLEQEYTSYKINQLTSRIAELQNQLMSISENPQVNDLKKNIVEAEEQVQELRENNECIERDLLLEKKKVKELEKNIKELEKKIKELEKNIKQSEDKNKEIEIKLKEEENKTKDADFLNKNKLKKKYLEDDSFQNNSFCIKEDIPNKTEDNLAIKKYILEIKECQTETKKILKDLNKNLKENNSSTQGDFYMKKIRALEETVEDLKFKNLQHIKNEQSFKDQKDSIVLLKETLESKDKTIQSQKATIEKLTEELKREKKIKNPFEGEVIVKSDSISKDAQPIEIKPDPWTVSQDNITKKKATKKSEKNVNVENIFREDNKSFFNNLSFSNSSPVISKKFKRNFK